MDLLKMIFPFSFNVKVKDVTSLVISIIIYIVGGFVAGLVIGLLGAIPVIGILFVLVGSVLGLYTLAGIVFAVLKFCDVLK